MEGESKEKEEEQKRDSDTEMDDLLEEESMEVDKEAGSTKGEQRHGEGPQVQGEDDKNGKQS